VLLHLHHRPLSGLMQPLLSMRVKVR
jgi:hypothetical protein